MKTEKRCVLFDLDGTLLDTLADIASAVNHMRRTFNLPLWRDEDVKTFIGDGIEMLTRRAVADCDITFEQAFPPLKEYYFSHLQVHTALYPGVAEGLKRLKEAGFILGVVTNKPEPAALDTLKMYHIDTFFDGIAGGGGAYPLKPSPAGCLGLLARFHAAPERSYMVGDYVADLAAGAGAGMNTVFARWGLGEPKDGRIDYAFDSFSEMTDFLTGVSEAGA